MAPSVVRDVKVFSRDPFVSSWDINAVVIRIAKSPNTIAIVASIAVYRSASPWACGVTVSFFFFISILNFTCLLSLNCLI